MRIQNSNRRTGLIIGIIIGVIFIIYLGFAIYFTKHFQFGSVINGVNYAGKTVDQVEKHIADNIDEYTLTLEGRDKAKETITSMDIDLRYVPDGTIAELKKAQNPLTWIFNISNSKEHEMTVTKDYNEESLRSYFNDLGFFDEKKVVAPVNASLLYNGSNYTIEKEIEGNQVKKSALYKLVLKSIEGGDRSLSLEENNCYVEPTLRSTNESLLKALDTVNLYVKTSITYDFSDRTETLNGDIIHNWLSLDEDNNVIIDDDSVIAYIKTLEAEYNSLGKSRLFTTRVGRTITVPSGNYGFMIRRADEKEEILSNIKEGKVIKREPIYAQRGYVRDVNDIGDTYVEISIKNQFMWFFKDGKILVKTKIVTGNESQKYDTPIGVYGITYKERNATLNGENYSSPVNYWLPFNGNIGIHDAGWRDKFGGEIYKTGGSHGCVNTPPANAQIIYENIEKGTPVIVY